MITDKIDLIFTFVKNEKLMVKYTILINESIILISISLTLGCSGGKQTTSDSDPRVRGRATAPQANVEKKGVTMGLRKRVYRG